MSGATISIALGSRSVILGAWPMEQCPMCPRLLASLVVPAPRPAALGVRGCATHSLLETWWFERDERVRIRIPTAWRSCGSAHMRTDVSFGVSSHERQRLEAVVIAFYSHPEPNDPPPSEASSVSSVWPKRDLSVRISIIRRYGESQLRKRGVPRGWGLDLVGFGGWGCKC